MVPMHVLFMQLEVPSDDLAAFRACLGLKRREDVQRHLFTALPPHVKEFMSSDTNEK